MTCETCGKEMTERMATIEAPYRYRLSGLSNVGLVGVRTIRCLHCAEETAVIPRIGELHRVLAGIIARKPGSLRGEELRFLRKFAGFPANKFARLVGVSAAHLSRVENGKRGALSKTADRLARAIALAVKDGKAAREVLLTLADELDGKKTEPRQLPLFRPEGTSWARAKAA